MYAFMIHPLILLYKYALIVLFKHVSVEHSTAKHIVGLARTGAGPACAVGRICRVH